MYLITLDSEMVVVLEAIVQQRWAGSAGLGKCEPASLCQRRQEWASVGRCGKVCVSAWVELGGTEY